MAIGAVVDKDAGDMASRLERIIAILRGSDDKYLENESTWVGRAAVVAGGPTDCTACNPNVYVTLTYQWNGSGFELCPR